MNDASKNNGNASATPQPSGHNSYAKLTEAEFLAHEAELAKTALGNALAELKGNFAKAGDIKLWAHHYPWLAVGLAAATGFTLAAVAKSGGADGSLAAEEEVERQRLLRETAKAPYNASTGDGKSKLGDSLLGSLFSLARTALEASLISAIREQGARANTAQAPTGPPSPVVATSPSRDSSETVAAAPT